MHRHAKEAEIGMGSLANVTSLNDVLFTSQPGDVFLQVYPICFFAPYKKFKKKIDFLQRKTTIRLIRMCLVWNCSLPHCSRIYCTESLKLAMKATIPTCLPY